MNLPCRLVSPGVLLSVAMLVAHGDVGPLADDVVAPAPLQSSTTEAIGLPRASEETPQPLPTLVPEEEAWLREHPVLRIAPDPDFPPLEFFDAQGDYQGLVADYVHEVVARLGVELEVVRKDDWSKAVDALRNGEADFIGANVPTERNRQEFLFTESYFGFYDAIVTHTGMDRTLHLGDLQGEEVLVVADWPEEHLLREQYPEIRVVPVPSTIDGLIKVSLKECDYLFTYLPTATYLIREGSLGGVHIAGYGDAPIFDAMMVRKDNRMLRDILQKALDSIPTSQRLAIESKWVPDLTVHKKDSLDLTPEEEAWVEAHPEITLSISNTTFPKSFVDKDGVLRGSVVDYARLIEERVGIKINLEGSDWATAYKRAIEYNVDGVLNASPLEERKAHLSFTQPYNYTPLVLLAHQSESQIKDLNEFNGRTVAAIHQSSYAKHLQAKFPSIDVKTYRTPEDTIIALLRNEVDGAFGGYEVFAGISKKMSLRDFRAIHFEYVQPTSSLCIGVRKDDPVLLSILDKGIESITEKDRIRIHTAWYGPDIPPSPEHAKRRPTIALTRQEQNWLSKHPVVRVGLPVDRPPLSFMDESGKLQGVFVDHLHMVSERTGVAIETLPISRWEKVAKAEAREIDVFPVAIISPDEDSADLTSEILSIHYVVITRQDAPFMADTHWLEGKSVLRAPDPMIERQIRDRMPYVSSVAVDSIEEALRAVSSGEADAYIGGLICSSYAISNEWLTNLKIAGSTGLSDGSVRFAVRDDWPELTGILNKVIATIEPDELNALTRKWQSVRYEQPRDWGRVWKWASVVVGSLLVLLALALSWSYQLKRVVSRRTVELRDANTSLEDITTKFEAVYNHHYQLTGLLDTKGRLLMANRASLDFAGATEQDVVGQLFVETPFWTHSPEAQSRLREAIKRVLAGESDHFETTHINAAGEEREFDFCISPAFDASGRVCYMVPEGYDITDRKRAEDVRLETLARFSGFAEASQYGMGMADLDGHIVYVNSTLVRMLGEESADDCLGKHFPTTYYPTAMVRRLQEEVLPALMRDGNWHGELELRTVDGLAVPTDENYFVIRDEDGEPHYLADILTDITDRRHAEEEREKLENQLRQAQKMEAIGQLAGGVAHDFNNLLQAILGYGELALDEAEPGSATRDGLEEVIKAGNRATTLVRQLLAFSRKQVLQLEVLDLNEVVEDLAKMVRRVIGEHIAFSINSEPGLQTVRADRGQIEQILMNLCVNGRDALPEGGRITITTRNAGLDEVFCQDNPWAEPGNYVLLSVSDTGCGMDDETKQRVFEPFFTTKAEGKGTGLGLSTVYGIVRQHKGMIHVYSEVGLGTEFKIYLPQSESTAQIHDNAVDDAPRGGTEMILLAEDNESVRSLAARFLETAGYTVLAAGDGEEAIRFFNSRADEIDLALLDIVMPKCGGRAVSQHIQEAGSEIPVLFASGYTAGAIDGFVLEDGMQLIQKPYQRDDLLRKVRHILDS